MKYMLPPKSSEAFFFNDRKDQMWQFDFHLGRDISTCPRTCPRPKNPKKVHRRNNPLNFSGIYFPPSGVYVSYQISEVVISRSPGPLSQ